MRVHLLQHSENSPPGILTQICSELELELRITRLDLGAPIPKLEDVDLLISVGGEMHARDKKRHAFLKDECRLIESSLKAEKPFLGICLGAELLADVLGARVQRGGQPERGWFEIGLDHQVLKLPMRPPKETLTFFSNHHDSFNLPEGARSFAQGHHCLNEGFTYQKSLAIQFHPNTQRETVLKISQEPIRKRLPAIQSSEELIQGLVHLKAQHDWLQDVVKSLTPHID